MNEITGQSADCVCVCVSVCLCVCIPIHFSDGGKLPEKRLGGLFNKQSCRIEVPMRKPFNFQMH